MALRLLLLVAALGIATGLVGGGVAVFHMWKGAAVGSEDATPTQLWKDGGIPNGSSVWLRGRRNELAAVTLADGRVLYPTRSEPRVMVDCDDTGCEGALVGRVEDLTLEGPLPARWPDDAGRHARVVVVGEPSDAAQQTTRTAGLTALAATAVGLANAVAAAMLYARRRRR